MAKRQVYIEMKGLVDVDIPDDVDIDDSQSVEECVDWAEAVQHLSVDICEVQ